MIKIRKGKLEDAIQIAQVESACFLQAEACDLEIFKILKRTLGVLT